MLPGFTALSGCSTAVMVNALPPRSRPSAAAPTDTWAKDAGGGRHQEPAGNWVNCRVESYCYGLVRMCHTMCDSGEDVRQPCGGCVGLGGISLDLW
jgi:hypothetical protein